MNKNNFLDCENCSNYIIDEEAQEYFCSAPLDEDDVSRLLGQRSYKCPYFDFYDEYKIVRKQN